MIYLNALDANSIFMDNNKLGLWITIAISLIIVLLIVSLIVLIYYRNKPIKVDRYDEVYGQAISETIKDDESHIVSERGLQQTIAKVPLRPTNPNSKQPARTVTIKKETVSKGRLG